MGFMNYFKSYARLTKQKRKKIIKKISIICGLLFIISIGFGSIFFVGLPFTQADTEQSTCVWYEYVEIPGSKSICEEYIERGLTEPECSEMPTNSPCPSPQYTPPATASISGCKYNDSDGDGDIAGEAGLAGWEIVLSGDDSRTQQTGQDGCYVFTGLLPGNYTVSETLQDGWQQTYPTDDSWTVELVEGENADEKHFGNVDMSLCEETDTHECIESGIREHSYTYNYGYCGENYTDNVVDASCDCVDSESSRECAANGQADVVYSWNHDYCGPEYIVSEQDEDCACVYLEWQDNECTDDGLRNQTRVQTSQFEYCADTERTIEDSDCDCIETENAGECVSDTEREYSFTYNFDYCQAREPENKEDSTCGQSNSGDSNDNQDSNSGGGGGGGFVGLLLNIKNTQAAGNLELNSITITWLTSHLATSRVVYDTVPHATVGDPPNYGYAYSTEEDPNKVTGHSVTITGLIPETAYYFRPISHGSPEVYGQEITFTTTGFGSGVGGELIDENLTDAESQEVEEVIVLGVENISDSEADAENNSEENTEVLAASGMGADEYALLIITMVALAGFAINLKIKYASDFGSSSSVFYKPIASKKYYRSLAMDKYQDIYKVKR